MKVIHRFTDRIHDHSSPPLELKYLPQRPPTVVPMFYFILSYSCLMLDVATLHVLHTNVCGVSNKPSSACFTYQIQSACWEFP